MSGARRLDDIRDSGKPLRADEQLAAKRENLGFAERAPLRVGDALQIFGMGEAEHAANHLGAGEGETVLEENAHESLALGFHRRMLLLRGEQARRISIALFRLAPERKEAVMKTGPDRLDLIEYPDAVAVALMGRGFMALLREIGDEEIADHRADIETDRPDAGEFGIDDARVVRREHDRSGMEIAVNQGLRARQELIFARLRRDLQRRVALEGLFQRIEIRAVPAIEGGLA